MPSRRIALPSLVVALVALSVAACSGDSGALSLTDTVHGTEAHQSTPKGSPESVSSDVIGDTELSANPNAEIGYPSLAAGAPEVLISRAQYLISWNKDHRELNWSAWRLAADDLGDAHRSNKFTTDQELAAYLADHGGEDAVKPTDYKKSCYDRGHQTPSGDRTATREDNLETFKMSNMIPQTAYLNRVIWEHLESHTRDLVDGTANVVYVFAGPIFDSRADGIGPDGDIVVPSGDFKIVAQLDGGGKAKVVASVIMPNVTSTGSDPRDDHDQACADQHHMDESGSNATDDWQQYTVELSEIEQQAGLDLSFLSE